MSMDESSTIDWRYWCRLCAKCTTDDTVATADSIEFLHSIIEKHLLTTLIQIEDFPLLICKNCKEFLLKLNTFSERCEQTENLFNYLLTTDAANDDEKLHTLRIEYGLDYEEKCSMLRQDQATDTDDLDENVAISERTKRSGRARRKNDMQPHEYSVEIQVEPINFDGKREETWFEVDSNQENDHQNYDYDNLIEDEELDTDNTAPVKSTKSKPPKKRKKAGNEKTCSICQTTFKRKRDYDEHKRSQHEAENASPEDGFLCPQCPKRFATSRQLQRHEVVHLPDELKLIHPCRFCDKRFSKLVNMQAHVRAIHTGDRPFICEECGKSFIAKGALKEHQIIHSDECPFQCSHCPKKFKNMARLRTHEDIHKHTMYVCPHCGLQLNTKRTLKMHMVVHSDAKRFKCQYCGNEYKRSKALKNHLILHTGLRPYTCPFCEKTFANGSNCRSHKKKAHPVELAALEASGQKQPATNIPKLEHLQPRPKTKDEEAEEHVNCTVDNNAMSEMNAIIVESDASGLVYQTFEEIMF